MNFFTISCSNLRFFSSIGVDPQERIVGNEFGVDVNIMLKDTNFIAERLDSTISYAEVFDLVSNVMSQEWLLLESVAKRIAETIADKWNEVYSIDVKITKFSPPIPKFTGMASVSYHYDRSR